MGRRNEETCELVARRNKAVCVTHHCEANICLSRWSLLYRGAMATIAAQQAAFDLFELRLRSAFVSTEKALAAIKFEERETPCDSIFVMRKAVRSKSLRKC